ncbi:uncharacterized protein LOC133526948 [Cydia pomonella]|uniref:uncharacterized protein LOC133526948 n=1 Tax=Cydia pomonella TaxID=82600 RepID=UPI002ADDAF06|nr:uncharacterized protein LOC133526948 [Cydia pomonella]
MFYIFITTLLVQTLIVTESLALNVRTTLFTPADLAKKRWNKREVALLRARMYCQDMIPPMEILQSPDYISSLIRYIENCYAAVNQAAFDAESGTILTVAASDVFGGYLKMVALPMTKLAYYNGDIPTKEAMKLFKYYDDIKNQLHTNGKGWSEPLKNIPKPQNVRGVRSNTPMPKIKNPCERLLYLNNNQQNVTMPMPSIDWRTRMMFVPLTNQPIVDLKSPLISSVLEQFHQLATACERYITPDRRYFQGSFEEWVNEAVVPHLSDDDLYTGFKGILSLIENANLVTGPGECKKQQQKHSFFNIFHNMSKKTIVITIILILELICCIPTLLYCVMKKKKKCNVSTKSTSSRKAPSHIHNRKSYNNKTVFYELSSPSSSFHSETKITSRGNASNNKKFMKNKISSELSNASGSRRSYSSIPDASTTADEALSIRKSSHQKILSSSHQTLRYKITETDEIDVSQGQTQVSKASLPRRSSTSTVKYTDDTGETITLSTVLPQDKSTSKVLRKSKRFKPRHVISSLSPDTYNGHPSSENIKANRENNISTVKELKLELFDERMDVLPLMLCSSDKTVEFVSPRASRTHTKNSEININRSMREKESQERVDRPSRSRGEKSRQRIVKNPEVMPQRKGILKLDKTKASKIPKIINSPRNLFVCSAPRIKRREPDSGRKSMIPKARQSIPERALDDSALASSSPREGKLNVTL